MIDCAAQPTTPREKPGFSKKPGFYHRRVAMVVALVLLAFARPSRAQSDDDDDRPQYRAGLVAEYTGADGKPHRRVDESLSFVWGSQPPDARLPAGDFTVRWRGRLFSIAPGEYRLHVYAAGAVKITLEKQVVLDIQSDKPQWLSAMPLKLTYGHHPLDVEFRKTADAPRIALYWQGPKFALEGVPAWHLFHDPPEEPSQQFAEGEQLAHALRCAACHDMAAAPRPLPAPALTRLSENIDRTWLVNWIQHAGHDKAAAGATLPASRMPGLGLSREEAEAIAEYLLAKSEKPAKRAPPPKPEPEPKDRAKDAKSGRKPAERSAATGRELFVTLGCLACHEAEKLGRGGLFGGGDLSRVAEKRPAEFFARWLAKPAELNPDHRMPVFPLTELERRDLSAYLATLKGAPVERKPMATGPKLAAVGRDLVDRHRCRNCHKMPGDGRPEIDAKPQGIPRLNAAAQWDAGCLGEPLPAKRRPGYRLPPSAREALQEYFTSVAPRAQTLRSAPEDSGRPALILAERNCLGCHARGNVDGLAGLLPSVVAAHPQLAPALSALKPPALHGIGDKLHEEALRDAILTKHGALRPWLRIRMPRFDLSPEEMAALVTHFTDTDRLQPGGPALAGGSRLNEGNAATSAALRLAGARLVTSDGFGCTSCHQIGRSMPEKDEIRSRGPDLAMLGRRVRREWFDRFTPNPARIVPNMEMPALVAPVRGVLSDRLDEQLAAVWHVLNQPDFQPPQPGAIRVVRCRNAPGEKERANVLTDVLKVGERVYVKPLLIGLSNRHNVLFDLETGSLAGWWIGDTARQYTKGKSWHWEPGGTHVIVPTQGEGDITRSADLTRKLYPPLRQGQFLGELDSWEHVAGGGLRFTYRLRFEEGAGRDHVIPISQTISPWIGVDEKSGAPQSGFVRRIHVQRQRLEFDYRLLPVGSMKDPAVWNERMGGNGDLGAILRAAKTDAVRLDLRGQAIRWPGDAEIEVAYVTTLPVDSLPDSSSKPMPGAEAPGAEARLLGEAGPLTADKLTVVPGYEAVRLPLPDDIMPTGLAWREDGSLVISDLKGRVLLARDSDGDGLEDKLTTLADGLAAPYGVAARDGAVDVIHKHALLRLHDTDGDGRADRIETLASGWGVTDDYHDWAVGLERDAAGNYYIALPCQQDNRTAAAAQLRGKALKLVPRKPTEDDPRPFSLEEICSGLRFPMGLAISRDGALFATDNQGNYNPFNELNHLRPGAHYGFVNKLDFRPGVRPPLTAPAIDIPHPWTRSVNGIAFLHTPPGVRQKLGRDLFGPFEGHLIGCEYDTRRLIRLSLQKVGDTYQGAAYEFTADVGSAVRTISDRIKAAGSATAGASPVRTAEPTLQGPVCCAVSPSGDLYIGNLRDSGWGGAANVGSIVRLRPSGKLPLGIAEVRATADGFEIDFTGPVNRDAASKADSYSISSYRRESTPAYGGPDLERRSEPVQSVELSPDARRARLKLDKLRKGPVNGGFVYEIRVKSLAPAGQLFHPDEAHFTLRRAAPAP